MVRFSVTDQAAYSLMQVLGQGGDHPTSSADAATRNAPFGRRNPRLRLNIARALLTMALVTLVLIVLHIAETFRSDDSTPRENSALLATGDGPPRSFLFVDEVAVTDALGQVVDRLPPRGSIGAERAPQARSRRVLELIKLLEGRQQISGLSSKAQQAQLTAGTFAILTAALVPAGTSRVKPRPVSSGLASIVSMASIRTRDLAWTPRANTPVRILAQVVEAPVGAPRTAQARILAIFSAR